MSRAVGRSEWRVKDTFGAEWRVFFAPFAQRTRESPADWQARAQIEQLVFDAFTPSGACDDRLASALLEIYDALTNDTLASRLPRPTRDPQRLLAGFDQPLRHELLAALRAGEIGIEPVARARWPFPDLPDAPVSSPDAPPVVEQVTWIGLLLVDQTGRPVPNRAYRVIFPDGTQQDGTLDGQGAAMLGGTVPGACQVYCPYAASHPKLSYEVQQGDHLSGIAESYGFDDYTLVWNDPGNAALKGQRSDPHVLLPGDALAIPELKVQPVTKPTGATHTFTIVRSPLKLRLTMLDLTAKAMVAVDITVDGAALTTDGSGLVEANIDKTEQSVAVLQGGVGFTLDVGAINPSGDTSDAGYKARLVNLGFLWDATVDDTDDEMIIALQDFQAQYELPVTGQLDDATKAQLAQSHGC